MPDLYYAVFAEGSAKIFGLTVSFEYLFMNGITPAYMTDLFAANPSRYALRNSDFIIPRFNMITHGKHSISYLGPTMWAKLSETLRKSKMLNIFKNRIRTMNLSELISENCQNCFLCSRYVLYIYAAHLSGPYSIRTTQGTNQNAPFHHGPVQPYNKLESHISLTSTSEIKLLLFAPLNSQS